MLDKKKKRLIMRSVILLILFGAIVYALYANYAKDNKGTVEVGEKAPDFVLEDLNGTTHKLSDYEGKGVFLNFWGTYCKPCEEEMPYMDNQYATFKDQGVQILAVNVGESDFVVEKFVNKYDLKFPVLNDKDKDVQREYDVFNLPVTFLIDSNGIVTDILSGSLTEEMIKAHMESIQPQ
ncbi:thiol-disulfide oxidoreductase [Bacillus coahuilensis p1.1.43]|uniref:Thiol-disulfide oxidoreductase n=1 Tax=Bacillus coahuilensis p1.1.43 TaxID=1150625 RepID=A0A147K7Z0_9BACI|nr:thiol-disulfide oxidoreductase ResA [Bacillus coahuilensis]KUP06246.1 thiol-disulfide oxidoreductase [Bacillus coahuilensis p1.1.43]